MILFRQSNWPSTGITLIATTEEKTRRLVPKSFNLTFRVWKKSHRRTIIRQWYVQSFHKKFIHFTSRSSGNPPNLYPYKSPSMWLSSLCPGQTPKGPRTLISSQTAISPGPGNCFVPHASLYVTASILHTHYAQCQSKRGRKTTAFGASYTQIDYYVWYWPRTERVT